jgi:predicted TIM-barrel fold metal-dependent hydrolase
MYRDEIIDTHMHLWDLKNDYQWLQKSDPTLEHLGGNYDRMKKNFLVDNYLALSKNQNVIKSVHIEAYGFKGNPVLETEWLQQQADHFGFPQGIVARAELNHPDIGSILESHCRYPNVRGVRMSLCFHDDIDLRMAERGDYYQDKAWQQGFSLLAKHNLSFDLQIYAHQIKDYIPIAKKFSDTRIIIDHFAWPLDLSEQGFKNWQADMSMMAQNPNVFVKLSGIGWVFRSLDFKQLSAYFHEAIALFGIERCIFGSNFPADGLFYQFDELVNLYKKILSVYSQEDQAKYFYQNAEKFYRL